MRMIAHPGRRQRPRRATQRRCPSAAAAAARPPRPPSPRGAGWWSWRGGGAGGGGIGDDGAPRSGPRPDRARHAGAADPAI